MGVWVYICFCLYVWCERVYICVVCGCMYVLSVGTMFGLLGFITVIRMIRVIGVIQDFRVSRLYVRVYVCVLSGKTDRYVWGQTLQVRSGGR